MGLDNFRVETEADTSNNVVESTPYESILTYTQGDAETDGHYQSKLITAIQLHKLGYDVSVEHKMANGLRCDVYAELNVAKRGIDIEDNQVVVCEIGTFTPSRAIDALDIADAIVWVPKGGMLNDGVLISDSHMRDVKDVGGGVDLCEQHKPRYKVATGVSFIDVYGNEFIPPINELYIDRYISLAKHVVNEYTDVSDYTENELINAISSSTGYKHSDVKKVLEVLEFI